MKAKNINLHELRFWWSSSPSTVPVQRRTPGEQEQLSWLWTGFSSIFELAPYDAGGMFKEL